MPHLLVAPILLPLLAAALMLVLGEQHRQWKAVINVASSAAGLLLALVLLAWVNAQNATAAIGIYLPANWDVPFGIVLALDRLSALMLVLTAIVALASVVFSTARWHRAGVHFHSLFQLQLMGLNGAFLTADLFNLFVFFEVTLAASYGLLLHGSGRERVHAGLHYIAVNLLASSLFLIGVAMLYGVAGTLNMADLARKLPLVPDADSGLLHAGAAILALAFLVKAAVWPLNFWLPRAYAAASAPVAALFTVLTKLGFYAVLRLWTLFFPASAGASALFGADVLLWGGLATLAFGAIGVLASQHTGRLAGYCLIVTSGTLLAAVGFGQPALTGGALYYLFSSTLALCALFLLVELIERTRAVEVNPPLPDPDGDVLPFFAEAFEEAGPDTNLDDRQEALVGRAIPAALVFLGLSFMLIALVVSGLPPLSGFVGKVAMLSAVLAGAAPPSAAAWTLLALLIGSGLLSTIALSRVGMRHFWAPQQRTAPRLRFVECAPIAALLLLCALLVVRAEPLLRYADATAEALHQPAGYIDAVMSARPVPGPAREDSEP